MLRYALGYFLGSLLGPLLSPVLRYTPKWLLKTLADFSNGWPWLKKTISAVMVNRLVNSAPHRPHPWSTAHDYVSWTSLSDHTWSGRHLAASKRERPKAADLQELFRRRNGAQRYCTKSTCLFPAFAQYLTDSILRTRTVPHNAPDADKDLARKQNTSTHHLDMCTLYGRLPKQTTQLRAQNPDVGNRGKLKSQMIRGEEYAPFLFNAYGEIKKEFDELDPPLGVEKVTLSSLQHQSLFAFGGDRTNSATQVAMMNTLFLREHNRVASLIAKAEPAWDDDRVFETTRNTIIVLFIKIVVEEYINHISRMPFRFVADPSFAHYAPWNKPNWITTEFSLLYRWHSLVPEFIDWGNQKLPVAGTFMNNQLLLGSGLAKAFTYISAQKAGRIGAFNTPDALMWTEELALKQDATCELAPYTDYREFVSLSRPQQFEDISKDPDVIAFLKRSYKSPDEVDFYVGLFAEDPADDSPLPELMLTMVAIDAFSQAFTNPLLSHRVFYEEATFSKIGREIIQSTNTLKDILIRNVNEPDKPPLESASISMTHPNWAYVN